MNRQTLPAGAPALVVFDVDGTLYEEPFIYERFAAEIARFVAPADQASFLAEWHAACGGRSPVRVGLGYDTATDTLFRHADGCIGERFDWQGHPLTAPTGRAAPSPDRIVAPVGGQASEDPPLRDASAAPLADAPAIETGLFGEQLLNIGDLWGLTDVIAAHYGVTRTQRSTAFLVTRACMDGPSFPLHPERGLRDALQRLRRYGTRIEAMTNSPPETTRQVLIKLGIRDFFDAVHAQARKPQGVQLLLAARAEPARVLVIGDNYINEIEPALRAGASALYIDRFATGFGAGRPGCAGVPSIPAMIAWLDELRDTTVHGKGVR